MGGSNSIFFDYEGDMLDEGRDLETAPENPSGDDEQNGGSGNWGNTSNNPVDDVVNDTSSQVSEILDYVDDGDDDF